MRAHGFAAPAFLTVALVAVLGAGLVGVAPAWASTTVDCGSGASLQAAIDQAPAGSTLALAGTCGGTFEISKSITLKASMGDPPPTLDAQGAGTTLTITHGEVHLDGLTITGGQATEGAGISNSGKLWLDRTTVTGNTASDGGGILNNGILQLTRSSVSSNGTPVDIDVCEGVHPDEGIWNMGKLVLLGSAVNSNCGGGIWNQGGSLLLEQSSVSANLGDDAADAVGIENEASAMITDSTVSYNNGEIGFTAGILNRGSMTISFSTIARNVTGDSFGGAAGITNGGGGKLIVTSSTISANFDDAVTGAGIENGDPEERLKPGTVKISGSILAGNGEGDCLGPITSEGFNIVGTLFGYPDCRSRLNRRISSAAIPPPLIPTSGCSGPTGAPRRPCPPTEKVSPSMPFPLVL